MVELLPQLPPFRDRALLQQALTHRSYVNENVQIQQHNERLEFLGDAILNFLSGEFLYQQYPEKSEGELTPLRSQLVDAKQLAEFAEWLNLGEKIRLGRGAARDGARTNPRILSSAFEAIVGAYFLDIDSDINPVRIYILPFFTSAVTHWTRSQIVSVMNYKSRFQEWALAMYGENPIYQVVTESGPDHAKTFIVDVQVRGKVYGQGTGRKKQDAEKDAARVAIDRLGLL